MESKNELCWWNSTKKRNSGLGRSRWWWERWSGVRKALPRSLSTQHFLKRVCHAFWHRQILICKKRWLGSVRQVTIMRKKANQSSLWQSHLAPQQHELVLLLNLPLTWADCKETPGDSEGRGGLGCSRPWGHKESDPVDTTGQLNSNNNKMKIMQKLG